VLLVLASTFPRWEGDPEPGFVQELARRLTGRFHVVALVPRSPGAASEENLQGVEVIRFRYAPAAWETLVNDGGIISNLRRQPWKWLLVPGFGMAQLWGAWRIVRQRRVRALHAHWLVPQGLVAAMLGLLSARAPAFLVTCHGADLFSLRGSLLARLKRFVADRAAAITVVSAAMRDELARLGVPPERVVVRSMGVDLAQRFTVDASVQRSADEILFVGRLVEKKGLVHLIDAMPAILAHRPGAFLTVAGFGPELAERVEQVSRLGLGSKVQFVGAVAQGDLVAHYRRAAVFVAPFVQAASGDQEGLGLVVVEAAGCGCPLVVADLPGVRDVFSEQPPAALVPPASPAALATAVCAVLDAPPDTSALREALLRRFDWRAVADEYGRLLSGMPDKAA
jgi:glycosyltransferase involved in cell wall biosynthesis